MNKIKMSCTLLDWDLSEENELLGRVTVRRGGGKLFPAQQKYTEPDQPNLPPTSSQPLMLLARSRPLSPRALVSATRIRFNSSSSSPPSGSENQTKLQYSRLKEQIDDGLPSASPPVQFPIHSLSCIVELQHTTATTTEQDYFITHQKSVNASLVPPATLSLTVRAPVIHARHAPP